MIQLKRFVKILASLALLLLLLFGWKSFGGTPVLMYHFVGSEEQASEDPLVISKKTFEKHLAWLKKWGYRVYSLDEYYQMRTGQLRLRQKGVAITFDDGNRDFVEQVFPILEREKVPAAIFLIWDNLSREQMGSMSIDQARELLKSPFVTFGVHTVHHKELVGLSDAELEEEIVQSKQLLEEALSVPLYYFSYPSGYFDQKTLDKVKKTGYRLAFTTSRKRLGKIPESLQTVPRIKITRKDQNFARFWFKASGFYSLFEKVKSVISGRRLFYNRTVSY